MTKKTRHGDEERERAIALYILYGNIERVAEEMHIAPSTIRGWIKKADAESGAVADLRAKKRAEFADRAWGTIDKGVRLLEREMTTALQGAEQIDEIIRQISAMGSDDMAYKDRVELIKRLSRIARPDMREITTAIGTMYDKAALARGESTANETFAVNIKVVD